MSVEGIRDFFSKLRFKKPTEPPQPIREVTFDELKTAYTDNICKVLMLAQDDPKMRANTWHFAQEEMRSQGKTLPWDKQNDGV